MTCRSLASMRASYLFPSTSFRSSSTTIARRRWWTVQNRTNTLCGWQTVRLSGAWRECGGGEGGGSRCLLSRGERQRCTGAISNLARGERGASGGLQVQPEERISWNQPHPAAGAFIKASLACFIKRCLCSDVLLSSCGVSWHAPVRPQELVFF